MEAREPEGIAGLLSNLSGTDMGTWGEVRPMGVGVIPSPAAVAVRLWKWHTQPQTGPLTRNHIFMRF